MNILQDEMLMSRIKEEPNCTRKVIKEAITDLNLPISLEAIKRRLKDQTKPKDTKDEKSEFSLLIIFFT